MPIAYRADFGQLVCVHMNPGGQRLVALPRSLEEALNILAEQPELAVVAGGTDAMVPVNAGRMAPRGWLSLRHVTGLDSIDEYEDGSIVVGAGITMATLAADTRPMMCALSEAARIIGSPQIRSMATVGGNIATGSPAGDALPPLLCGDASVELVSVSSTRLVPLADFLVGPKRTSLQPGELIRSLHLPARAGEQLFTKVGPRNAMVIAVCSLSARFDRVSGDSAVAVGSVAATAIRLGVAESLLVDPTGADDFADAVAASIAPIDDIRSSAAYRVHAMRVIARRAHCQLHAPSIADRAAS